MPVRRAIPGRFWIVDLPKKGRDLLVSPMALIADKIARKIGRDPGVIWSGFNHESQIRGHLRPVRRVLKSNRK
jgi:hypothetical protein